MNIVRILRLLQQSTLLLVAVGASILLTACGGGGSSGKSSSSSSSSSSSHVFSSTPVTPSGSGTWPEVKVSASGTKTLKFDWTPVAGSTYYKLMKKPDSDGTYTQVGADLASNSATDSVSVHLTDWVNSRYKVQACNDAGCQDSNPIVADSAMNSAITYLKASNTEANDWFGWSVTISGDGKTMAIGAPTEASSATGINGDQTSNASTTSGAVYVFAKVDGNWQQEAYLKASNTEQPSDGVLTPLPNPNARFGYQVALSTDGNTLAVSAINEDSVSIGVNCDPHNLTYSSASANSQGFVTKTRDTNIGAVYVFKRNGVQWTQQAYIKPIYGYNNGNSSAAFGSSLALSGDGKTLVVGVALDNRKTTGITPATLEGDSSVAFKCLDFSSSSSTSSSSTSSTSSSSVSSSSKSSANSSSTAGGTSSGAVYIYTLGDGGWIEQAYLKAADADSSDEFGTAVALSYNGDTLVVGAPNEDSKDTSDKNDTVTIDDLTYKLNNGGVYLFARSGITWTQNAKIKPSNPHWEQAFGAAVAISGDGLTLAVGAPGDKVTTGGINPNGTDYKLDPQVTAGSGSAYVFTKSDSAWSQQAYIKAANPVPYNSFGSAVSLSGNGNILAVGTWLESSQATGINGDQLDTGAQNAGAAFVFTRAGATWKQQSYVKSPNTNAEDRFGRSLALDDLGENLLIGAHRESSNAAGINGNRADNSAPTAGAAYLY